MQQEVSAQVLQLRGGSFLGIAAVLFGFALLLIHSTHALASISECLTRYRSLEDNSPNRLLAGHDTGIFMCANYANFLVNGLAINTLKKEISFEHKDRARKWTTSSFGECY